MRKHPNKTVRKHPNQVPKGPQPSPERAPTKSRKGPRPCESTPDSDLNEAKLCPIRPSVLLVFLNSQCRASFRPLPLQHAMPFWCQQNESTHHFLKSLTFRRPTILFRDFDFATVFHGLSEQHIVKPPALPGSPGPSGLQGSKGIASTFTRFTYSSALRGLWGGGPPTTEHTHKSCVWGWVVGLWCTGAGALVCRKAGPAGNLNPNG